MPVVPSCHDTRPSSLPHPIVTLGQRDSIATGKPLSLLWSPSPTPNPAMTPKFYHDTGPSNLCRDREFSATTEEIWAVCRDRSSALSCPLTLGRVRGSRSRACTRACRARCCALCRDARDRSQHKAENE